MSSVKEKCLYCDKNYVIAYMGPHLFSAHLESITEDLIKQSRAGLIEMPISIKGLQFCLITKKVWKKPNCITPRTSAVKHMENECWNKENQLKELYRITGTSPTTAKNVFIDYDLSKRQSDESKALDLAVQQINERDIIINKLRAEIAVLKHDRCDEVKRIADTIRSEIAIHKLEIEDKIQDYNP